MKKIALILHINVLFFSFHQMHNSERLPAIACPSSLFQNSEEWIELCLNTKPNRDGASPTENSVFNSIHELSSYLQTPWDEFSYILQLWQDMMIRRLSHPTAWSISNHKKTLPDDNFFNPQQKTTFQPYAQKIITDANHTYCIRGDLHGDIISLAQQLRSLQDNQLIDENLRIIPDNFYILFLGDYVDRGAYGCEVIYTLLRLSLANPDRVVLVRGNHEDMQMTNQYNFDDEVAHKLSDSDVSSITTQTRYQAISRLYDFLPVVLFIGCQEEPSIITNFIQCCHGGIEIGYNPQFFLQNRTTHFQLIGQLTRKKNQHQLGEHLKSVNQKDLENNENFWFHYFNNYIPKTPSGCDKAPVIPIGFLWNDFELRSDEPNNFPTIYRTERSVSFGHRATEQTLQSQSSAFCKIIGILRAHQHSSDPNDELMKMIIEHNGACQLWTDATEERINGRKVITMQVAADTIFNDPTLPRMINNYPCLFQNAFAMLAVASNPNNWRLHKYNLDFNDGSMCPNNLHVLTPFVLNASF